MYQSARKIMTYITVAIGISILAWDQISNNRLHPRSCHQIHNGKYESLESFPRGYLHWLHRNVRHYTGSKPDGLAINYRYSKGSFENVPADVLEELVSRGYVARAMKKENHFEINSSGDQFISGTALLFGELPAEKVVTWDGKKMGIKCLLPNEFDEYGITQRKGRIIRPGTLVDNIRQMYDKATKEIQISWAGS